MKLKAALVFFFCTYLWISLSRADNITELDLEECVRLGVKNNLQIKRAGFEVLYEQEVTNQIKARYEPVIDMKVARTGIRSTGANPLLGTRTDKESINVGINKKLHYTGGMLNLDWNNEKIDSNSIFQSPEFGSFNPTFDSNITLSYTQPLMKNFIGRNDRVLIEISELGEKIAELRYMNQKNVLINQIENAYLSLNFTIKNLETQRLSLERSRKLLAINRVKLRDGLIEEVDVIATEAAITLNEASILIAENSVMDAEDELKRIIGIADDKECIFEMESVDEFEHIQVEVNEVIRKALSKRYDLTINKNIIKIDSLNNRIRRNERLPAFEFITRYGLGNTGEGWSDNYKSIISRDNPIWYVGLNLNIFPLRKLAKSRIRQNEYIYEKSILFFEDQRQAIITECRSITRRINTLALYVSAAKSSMAMQEKKLKLEGKKFNQGRSSIQWLLSYQDDLSRAQIEYYKALTDYYKAKSDMALITGEVR